jgi:hypothetical protein
MGAPEPMTGLSQPPPDRDLPDLPRHRRELLAVIAGRQGLRRAPRWAATACQTAAAPSGGITVLDDVGSVTITGSDRDTVAVTERLS